MVLVAPISESANQIGVGALQARETVDDTMLIDFFRVLPMGAGALQNRKRQSPNPCRITPPFSDDERSFGV